MKFCNYKCVITGGNFDAVHHLTPFRDIVDETFELVGLDKRNAVLDYTDDEFNVIRNKLHSLHNQYGFGACLDKRIHNLFHVNYGYFNFSLNNFVSFVEDLQNGVFDDFLLENNIELNINNSYVDYIRKGADCYAS